MAMRRISSQVMIRRKLGKVDCRGLLYGVGNPGVACSCDLLGEADQREDLR
jgi:hypothetical protein